MSPEETSSQTKDTSGVRKSPMDREMTFLEHLEELRRCLIIGLMSVAITTVVCMVFFGTDLMNWLRAPAPMLYGLTPTESIMTQIKVSLIAGLFISFPILAWQIWRFVSPGLYFQERKYLKYFVFFAWVFFVAGGAFARYVMIPFFVTFFTAMTEQSNSFISGTQAIDYEELHEKIESGHYGKATIAGNYLILEPTEGRRLRYSPRGNLESALALTEVREKDIPIEWQNVPASLDNMWSLASYTSLAFWMLLIFGVVFDLPVAMSLLTIMGVVNHRFLIKHRKYAYVIILIAAAIFTPQDAFTMIIMAIPLTILFEVSIVASWWFRRKPVAESATP